MGGFPNKEAQFEKGWKGGPGRPKGAKNRSTLLKKWLEMPAKFTNPETKEQTEGTIEEKVELVMIAQAMKGNVQAYKEIKDTLYGKMMKNIHVTGNVFEEAMKKFGDDGDG